MTDEEQRAKRRADVQITKDDPSESGDAGHAHVGEGITKASEDVLASRKKVSVRRSTAPPPVAPKASNPFAGIALTAPAGASVKSASPAAENGTGAADTTPTEGTTTAPAATKPSGTAGGFGGFAASAGSGLSGFGGFGGVATANGGSASGFGGLAFGSSTSLAFGAGPRAGADAQDTAVASTAPKVASEPTPSVFGAQPSAPAKEEPREVQQTGEEEEETVRSCTASLYEFVEEDGKREWRTRGSGEFKLNKDKETGEKGRLIMRQRGVGRLLLNANVYKNMTVSIMADGNGISFSCVNSVRVDGASAPDTDQNNNKLSMFAVKLGKDAKDEAEALATAIKAFI